MRRMTVISSGCAMAVMLSGPASAADIPVAPEPVFIESEPDEPLFDISFGAAAMTDYIFRGFTQTDGNPAVQGYVEATYSIVYAGIWASNVEFADIDPFFGLEFTEKDVELNFYGGIRPEFGDLSFDLGLVYYYYPELGGNFFEAKAAAAYAINDMFTIGVDSYYTPDVFDTSSWAFYAEANAEVSLPHDFSISGALGHQWFEDDLLGGEDYLTWNVGLAYKWQDTVTFDLRYHDTDTDLPGGGSKIVGTVSFDTSFNALRRNWAR